MRITTASVRGLRDSLSSLCVCACVSCVRCRSWRLRRATRSSARSCSTTPVGALFASLRTCALSRRPCVRSPAVALRLRAIRVCRSFFLLLAGLVRLSGASLLFSLLFAGLNFYDIRPQARCPNGESSVISLIWCWVLAWQAAVQLLLLRSPRSLIALSSFLSLSSCRLTPGPGCRRAELMPS